MKGKKLTFQESTVLHPTSYKKKYNNLNTQIHDDAHTHLYTLTLYIVGTVKTSPEHDPLQSKNISELNNELSPKALRLL